MRLPVTIIPYGGLPTFIFSLIISLIIYLPVVLFLLQAAGTGNPSFELFIVSGFGLIFGTIFRSIQGQSISRIIVDWDELELTFFRFEGMEVESFPRANWEGLSIFKDNVRGTNNFKVCLILNDGRQVMLEHSIFKKRAEKMLKIYTQILGLKEIQPPEKQIVNDGNFHFGSGR